MLRWLTAGESHGPALVAILEGLPAGVHVTTSDIAAALARRRLGYGRGVRMSFEQDEVTVLSGVRHGVTLGSPVAVQIGNTEWPKWDRDRDMPILPGCKSTGLPTHVQSSSGRVPGKPRRGLRSAR